MVAKGFKNTEIGVIPEDWEVYKFFDLFEFKSTASYSRAEISSNGTYGYIHYGDIHTRIDFHLDINKYVSGYVSKSQLKSYSFIEKGDLIMADVSEDYEGIGKSFEVINEPKIQAISGLHTFLIRPRNKNVFAEKFNGYLHVNPFIKKQFDSFATGLKVFSLSKGSFNFLQIPLPPLPEQKAIAEALSDADAWIASLEQMIAKKRLIKQGAMQQMLSPKEDWEVKKLGEVCISVASGTSDTLNDGNIFPIQGSTGIIGFKNHYDYEGENLTVARVGANAGFVRKISGKYCVSDNTLLLVTKSKELSVNFLYYSLINKDLSYLVFGSGQPLITGGQLKDLEIVLPSLTEQTRIATILSDMDSEIESLENQLAKARQIKQGMMQELLTGRVRLV